MDGSILGHGNGAEEIKEMKVTELFSIEKKPDSTDLKEITEAKI